jgi:hypothetical protein
MNRVLKAQIVLHYGSQAAAAPDLGINERRLSRIIHGYEKPRPAEAEMLRTKLGVTLEGEAEGKRVA